MVRMAVHMEQCSSTLFGMQTHFQSTQTFVAHLCIIILSRGPPVANQWSSTGVAKRGAFDVLGNLRKCAYICPEKFVTGY